jgi:hypothetical protein
MTTLNMISRGRKVRIARFYFRGLLYREVFGLFTLKNAVARALDIGAQYGMPKKELTDWHEYVDESFTITLLEHDDVFATADYGSSHAD